MATKSPRPVDVEIGRNIRVARLQRGMSQTELGNKIGVTFQQVQKYEKGANRVGGSRMTQIADVLGIAPADLFPPQQVLGGKKPKLPPLASQSMLATRIGLDIIDAWENITGDQRTALRALILAMAESN